ncbi:MAG: LPS-assembly protein LptD [Thiohalospira sp.]
MPSRILTLLVLVFGLAGQAAAEVRASERFGLCTPLTFPPAALDAPPDGAMSARARRVELVRDGVSTLEGDVALRRGERQLTADRATLNATTERARAEGDLRFWDDTVVIEGDQARMSSALDTGEFERADFRVPEPHARGGAGRIRRLADGRTRMWDVRYTTCDPGRQDWLLDASRVTLDHDSGRGYARHTVLRAVGVPVFYIPWMTFPITEDRLTGLLSPTFDVDTDDGSYDIAIPIYLNLAPNYDATLIPRIFDDRGEMLGAEFRYLTEDSEGEIRGDYLPDDQVYGDDRYSYELEHQSTLGAGFSTRADLEGVSDEDYHEDISKGFASTSARFSEQTAELAWSGDWLDVQGRVERYRPIHEDQRTPYERRPQVTWETPESWAINRPTWQLEGEHVEFTSNDEDRRVGKRQDHTLTLGWPLETTATFFRPGVALRHTAWDLDADPADPAAPREFDRSLPIWTLDTGLFLERPLEVGRPLLQTLEPRLYYVDIPYRDQEAIPTFDTGEQTFNFGQLFQPNRYTGPDRIGDTRRLTTAVTTRFLDRTSGEEYLAASAGQIRYFTDREVTLGGEPATATESDIAGELRGGAGPWRATGSLLYDTEFNRPRQRALRLQYKAAPRRLVNLDYRDRINDFEAEEAVDEYQLSQAGASAIWAFSDRWHVILHDRYDLREQFHREVLFGIGYDSCCWGVRLVARRYQEQAEPGPDETRAELVDRNAFLEFELKGLSAIGSRLDEMLHDSIYGYEPRFEQDDADSNR